MYNELVISIQLKIPEGTIRTIPLDQSEPTFTAPDHQCGWCFAKVQCLVSFELVVSILLKKMLVKLDHFHW